MVSDQRWKQYEGRSHAGASGRDRSGRARPTAINDAPAQALQDDPARVWHPDSYVGLPFRRRPRKRQGFAVGRRWCSSRALLARARPSPGDDRDGGRKKEKRVLGIWQDASARAAVRPFRLTTLPCLFPLSLPLLLSRESRSLAGRLTSASCCILATLGRSRRRWTRQAISHVWSLTTQRRRPFVYRSADLNPSPCRLRSSVSTLDRATPRSVSLAVRPRPLFLSVLPALEQRCRPPATVADAARIPDRALLSTAEEGHADCIANEEGERQIACAISYNGDQIVSRAPRE
jgi:hypothetical protein